MRAIIKRSISNPEGHSHHWKRSVKVAWANIVQCFRNQPCIPHLERPIAHHYSLGLERRSIRLSAQSPSYTSFILTQIMFFGQQFTPRSRTTHRPLLAERHVFAFLMVGLTAGHMQGFGTSTNHSYLSATRTQYGSHQVSALALGKVPTTTLTVSIRRLLGQSCQPSNAGPRRCLRLLAKCDPCQTWIRTQGQARH